MEKFQRPKVDLVAPRHPQAYPRPLQGHVMMPGALLSVASRLISAGVKVRLTDENLHSYRPSDADAIGCNLPGAPSIPVVQGLQRRIGQTSTPWFMGGQVCDGLSPEQFTHLFGPTATSGKNFPAIAQELGIDLGQIPSPNDVSLVPAFELIGDKDMQQYMRHEMPLHVSQGCKFRCEHCSADRGREESYRGFDHIREDLTYLRERADRLGVQGPLSVFMSNLDVFQNPGKLEEFADLVLEAFGDRPAFKFRGLSTFNSFLNASRRHPETVEKMIRAGFHNVGFGLDGYGEDVWSAIKKRINTETACTDSIELCNRLEIQPEVLMVTGHSGVDTDTSLHEAYDFLDYLVRRYGVKASPYVATPCIPGSNGWHAPGNEQIVNQVMSQPWLFQAFEFAAFAGPLKGHEPNSAASVNHVYRQMCKLPGSTTRALYPLDPDMNPIQRRWVRARNFGQFERL